MRGYDWEMSKKECLFWATICFVIAGTIAGMQCGCQMTGSQPAMPGDNPVVNYNYNGVAVGWVVLYTILGVVVTMSVLYGAWKFMEYRYIKPRFRK